MAIAFRPRRTPSKISSRYGSHALAVGARPGGGSAVAGSALVAESVDTAVVVAGFAGATRASDPRDGAPRSQPPSSTRSPEDRCATRCEPRVRAPDPVTTLTDPTRALSHPNALAELNRTRWPN